MSHITKISSKIQFAEKESLKTALIAVCGSIVEEKENSLRIHVPGGYERIKHLHARAEKDPNITFRLTNGVYAPFGEEYGMYKEFRDCMDGIAVEYQKAVATKAFRKMGYRLSCNSENAQKAVVVARRY